MRTPGPIGGGTACRDLPQLGQNSSPALGPERCARSQCPRAEHSWLMHCTVHPGKYCMLLPPVAADDETLFAARRSSKMPDCEARSRWCQEQTTQDVGVWWRGCEFPRKLGQREKYTAGIDRFPSPLAEFSRRRPAYQ